LILSSILTLLLFGTEYTLNLEKVIYFNFILDYYKLNKLRVDVFSMSQELEKEWN